MSWMTWFDYVKEQVAPFYISSCVAIRLLFQSLLAAADAGDAGHRVMCVLSVVALIGEGWMTTTRDSCTQLDGGCSFDILLAS
jgi:hypothetical protein